MRDFNGVMAQPSTTEQQPGLLRRAAIKVGIGAAGLALVALSQASEAAASTQADAAAAVTTNQVTASTEHASHRTSQADAISFDDVVQVYERHPGFAWSATIGMLIGLGLVAVFARRER